MMSKNYIKIKVTKSLTKAQARQMVDDNLQKKQHNN